MSAAKKIQSHEFQNSRFESYSIELLSKIIKKTSGIDLAVGKEALIQARLSPRLVSLGIKSLKEYNLKLQSSPEELQICIELLTTHKTEWFREIVHYQWLKKDLESKHSKFDSINIWSAASSTGLEAYSILMLLLRSGFAHNRFKILGTDISRKVLVEAAQIPFSDEFLYYKKKLVATTGLKNPSGELDMALHKSIKFREFNLIESQLDSSIKFDYIFLRNVLIYFDSETCNKVAKKLSTYLKTDGYLILGVSESLQPEVSEFTPMENSIYKFNNGNKP